jgi:molecular chaperone GrpE
VSRPELDPKEEKEPDVKDLTEGTAPAADIEPREAAGLEAVPEGEPSLEEELAALRQERNELKDALLRRRAEFENYRRRTERDRHTAAQDAVTALLREVVATVDNLERALAATGDEQGLRQGVELTHRELLGVLESHDVATVDPKGEAFDPTHHEALLHEPVPGLPEGEVAEVFRKGYSYGDRLLRPALVKVAKGEDADETSDDTEAQ